MISDNTDILAPYLGKCFPYFPFSVPLSRNKSNTRMQMLKGTKMCLKVFSFCLGTMVAVSRRLACLLKLDLNHQCNSGRKL